MITNKDSSAAGTDNRPSMLEENDYESWRIPPEGGAVPPSRNKRDEEFTEEDNRNELADIQDINILSQGIPRRIFNILNQNEPGREIWALETELTQLKDTVTYLKIQNNGHKNDGHKVINANLNRCYEELSKANTHLRTTSLEKIAAQKAEIATLNAKTVGNKTSGTIKPVNPKVIAPGMYAISPKYIVPQRRTNRETPFLLPKKKQVTFQETPKPSPIFTKKPVAPLLKKPNVNVPLSIGIKSATGASKHASKSNAWIYRKLLAKSEKGEKVEEHIRNLNKNNRVDSYVKRSVSAKNLNAVCGACHECLISSNHGNCLVYSVKSVNHKQPKAKNTVRTTKKRTACNRESITSVLEEHMSGAGKPVKKVLRMNLSVHRCSIHTVIIDPNGIGGDGGVIEVYGSKRGPRDMYDFFVSEKWKKWWCERGFCKLCSYNVLGQVSNVDVISTLLLADTCGLTFDEQTKVRKVLNAVPDKFLPVVAIIEMIVDFKIVKLKEIIEKLKTYEERIKFRKESQEDNSEKLLLTRQMNNKNHKHNYRNGRRRDGNQIRRRWKDRDEGHTSDESEGTDNKPRRNGDKSQIDYYKCGKLRHYAYECSNKKKEEITALLVEINDELALLIHEGWFMKNISVTDQSEDGVKPTCVKQPKKKKSSVMDWMFNNGKERSRDMIKLKNEDGVKSSSIYSRSRTKQRSRLRRRMWT
nr:zinc finger, CCHC-type [Tanacetum cinerariifolium]